MRGYRLRLRLWLIYFYGSYGPWTENFSEFKVFHSFSQGIIGSCWSEEYKFNRILSNADERLNCSLLTFGFGGIT